MLSHPRYYHYLLKRLLNCYTYHKTSCFYVYLAYILRYLWLYVIHRYIHVTVITQCLPLIQMILLKLAKENFQVSLLRIYHLYPPPYYYIFHRILKTATIKSKSASPLPYFSFAEVFVSCTRSTAYDRHYKDIISP